MRSRKVILGAAGLAVLAIVAVIALLVGRDAIAAIAVIIMLMAVGVLVLDGVITLRRTERQLHKLTKTVRAVSQATTTVKPPSIAPAATEADLMGTIRLLQAQYVGRLDRAQAALDAAVDRLPARDVGRE